MAKSKKLTRPFVVLLLFVGLIIYLRFGRWMWNTSAVCPKCLQSAEIYGVKIVGVPIFKWTTYKDYVRLSPSWSDYKFSLDTEINPNIYRQIFDRRCHHELKKDSTVEGSFLSHVHRISSERRLYQSRIEAVAVLYSVFMRLPNKPLAQRTYKLIDSIIPMNQEDNLQKIFEYEKRKGSDSLFEEFIKDYFPTAFEMYLRIQELREFNVRMLEVETENQWESLLSELAERVDNIKLSES